jgi:predicted nucleic acid-binding protein
VTTTFTFDTGMLIALERRKTPATEVMRAITRIGVIPVVPAIVYAEWWRGRTDIREEILAMVSVEPMPPLLCRAAGEALAAVRNAGLADAVVMASAALRGGGVVYTSDEDDLTRLQRHFSTVRVLSI